MSATRSARPFDTRDPQYQQLKKQLHRELLDRLNLHRLTRLTRAQAEPQVRTIAAGMLDADGRAPLTLIERETLVGDVLDELFALGPIEALMRDPNVSDILVNRFDQVWVERHGCLELTTIMFRDDAHLLG